MAAHFRAKMSLILLIVLTGAAVPQVIGEWPTPSKTVNSGGKFWDQNYNDGVDKKYWAQHIGVDLKASTKDNVYSPVEGYVIFNNTRDYGVTQGKAYLIIKDISTGWEHVIGHIRSSYPTCAPSHYPKKCSQKSRVYKNVSYLGYPAPRDEFPVHIHWGLNKNGVAKAMGFFTGAQWKKASGKQWGWGRAPFEAEKSMACGLGWADPTNYGRC